MTPRGGHVTGYQQLTSTMARVVIVTMYAALIGCVLPLILALDPNPRTETKKTVELNGVVKIENGYSNADTASMVTDSEWIPNKGNTSRAGMGTGWSSCPQTCVCDQRTRNVRCHGNDIPDNIPSGTVSLNLSLCDSYTGKYSYEQTTQSLTNETTLGNSTTYDYDSISEPFNLIGLSDLSSLQILDLSCRNIHVLDTSHFPRSLTHLYLHSNRLARLDLPSLVATTPQLVHLDVSDNRLVGLSTDGQQTSDIINGSLGYAQGEFNETGSQQSSLVELVLSLNKLKFVPVELCFQLPVLKALDISDNDLQLLPASTFAYCSQLKRLTLARNPIADLPRGSFTGLSQLLHLNLSALAIRVIHAATFDGLLNLRTLDLSHNTQLQVIHVHAFQPLTSLEVLDLRHCDLATLHDGTFNGLQASIYLAGNPWGCNCNLHWLLFSDNATYTLDDPLCSVTSSAQNYTFSQVPQNDTCEGAFIVTFTEHAYFKVASAAILDCVAYGDPAPTITWTTPRNLVFTHHPATADHERQPPSDPRYHADHPWHQSGAYMHQGDYERIHLLSNGSLYIDYVSRADGGTYRCKAFNTYGNDKASVRFYLDYTGLFDTILVTMLVGLAAAIGFLAFGLLVGVIRGAVSWCRIRHKEDANKRFKDMIHSISDYKAAQIDRLSAYKAAKIGQLSALRHSCKMDALLVASKGKEAQRSVEEPPESGHHMAGMREHYSRQIDVIRENCAAKAERLRENYEERVQRFRDFRSHKVGKLRGYKAEKVERMRDNYHAQVQRLRDYSSQQMARLRSGYKLQQHYLLKLYELLDIANCLTQLQPECLRTESMLFDDAAFMHALSPVKFPAIADSDDEDDGSYYVTASSQSDVSIKSHHEGLSMHESASDDLEPEPEINLSDDIEIEPFPPYLNFLEAITLETQKHHHKHIKDKSKKQKRKSKKEKKKQKSGGDIEEPATTSPQKQCSKKSKRKTKVRERRSVASDDSETDNEQQMTAHIRTERETSTSPRKHGVAMRTRSKPSSLKSNKSSHRENEIQLSVHRPLMTSRENTTHLPSHMGEFAHAPLPHLMLSPSFSLSLRSHLDEDAQSSLYESAQASREGSPQLRDNRVVDQLMNQSTAIGAVEGSNDIRDKKLNDQTYQLTDSVRDVEKTSDQINTITDSYRDGMPNQYQVPNLRDDTKSRKNIGSEIQNAIPESNRVLNENSCDEVRGSPLSRDAVTSSVRHEDGRDNIGCQGNQGQVDNSKTESSV